MDGDDFVLRHADCAGDESGPSGCVICAGMLTRGVAQELCKWSYRIDLAEYASRLAYGSQEQIQEQTDVINCRDYKQCGMAGGDFATLVAYEDKANAIFTVRKQVESIPFSKRSDSLQGFIDLRLKRLGDLSIGNVERETFSVLVNKFSVACNANQNLKGQLQLAAQIAGGALAGDACVDALVKSFVSMRSKQQRGKTRRSRTSEFVTGELAADLVCALGKGASLSAMLKWLDLALCESNILSAGLG